MYQQLLIAAVVGATFAGFDFINPFLPLYITELGVTDLAEAALWSGLVVGIGPLLSSISSPVWGMMGDRFGLKTTLLRILVVFSVTIFLMGLVSTPLQLFVLRLIFGLCGGFTVITLALASSTAPPDQIGRAIGRLQMAQSLPMVFVPVIAGWIADHVGMRTNFFLASGTILLIMIVFLLGYHGPDGFVRKQPQEAGRSPLGVRQLILQPGMLAVFGVLFTMHFVEHGLTPMLPLLVLSFQVPSGLLATLVGIVAASGPVTASIASLAVARLLTGKGEQRRLLIVALPATALGYLGLVFAGQFLDVLLLRALTGLLYGGLTTIAFTAGTLATRQERSGVVFGAMSSAAMLGRAAGPLAAGALAAVDFRAVFVLDAALLIATLLAVLLWLHPSKRPEDTATPVPSVDTR